MEVIKKKICLESFISRIPTLFETIESETRDYKVDTDGSWGEIPKPVTILGKTLRYGSLMKLYYDLIRVLMESKYYEYDIDGKKWLEKKTVITETYYIDENGNKIDSEENAVTDENGNYVTKTEIIIRNYDWRTSIEDKNILYCEDFPTTDLVDKMVIGITDSKGVYDFYSRVQNIYGPTYNGFDIIESINNAMGRVIVPYIFNGLHVPYFLFLTDVCDLITKLEGLKDKSTIDCCKKLLFEEYGGDDFLNYLISLNEKELEIYKSSYETTLDIPIFLHTDANNLGDYKVYNVDNIDEETGEIIKDNDTYCHFCGKEIDGIIDHSKCHPTIVLTTGESKLKTLRKRKISLDDKGNELPGIYNSESNILENPYKVGYIKNTQISNDKIYGDMIVSTEEDFQVIETTENTYEALKERINLLRKENIKINYREGDVDYPIEGLLDEDVKRDIGIGNSDKTEIEVLIIFENEVNNTINDLKNKMLSLLKEEYPTYFCYKQHYRFDYSIIYGEEDPEKTIEDEDGNITPVINEKSYKKIVEGDIFVTCSDINVVFTYVLGGRLRQETIEKNGKLINSLSLDENSPFSLKEGDYKDWDGNGIWYRESFPLKKLCIEDFTVNGNKKTFIFDKIDFSSKEITLNYKGIDFPRKNYILCNDIRYKSDSYHNYCTNDPIFRDEKSLGFSIPIKEKYDVAIDRGSSRAFEKHLQLSEIKTWNDLEKYNNGNLLKI